jgi:hypothetical protein
MKANKSRSSSRVDPPKPLPVPADPEPAAPVVGPGELSRLAIPIRADGSVAVDRMRETTKKQLADLVKDPALARALGVASDASTSALPPALIRPMVHTLSQLHTIIVARVTAAPANIVLRIAPYTDDEQAMIGPALQAVLDKYAGSFFGAWGDEIGLALLLVTVTQSKIQLVQEEVRRQPARVYPMPATDAPQPAVTDAEPIGPSSEPHA